ncbi:MAG: Colicin production protein [Bryobacterales bacterium]|nr:Colicin production protein [Bryobacterales bacterium]
MNLNWLDILFTVVLLYAIYRSFRKGFVREIVGLASTILALLCSMWFHGIAGAYLEPLVHSEKTANLLGYIVVFLVVMTVGTLAGWIIARFIQTIGLSFVDRFMGAMVGLVRGLVVCIALLIGFTAYGPHLKSRTAPDAVLNSQIAPWLMKASDYGVAMAPMELKRAFREYYGEVKGMLRQAKF